MLPAGVPNTLMASPSTRNSNQSRGALQTHSTIGGGPATGLSESSREIDVSKQDRHALTTADAETGDTKRSVLAPLG